MHILIIAFGTSFELMFEESLNCEFLQEVTVYSSF